MCFKCAIGIKSERQKVANLMDAIRASLLEAAKMDNNAALEETVRAVDMRYVVKGDVIKDIARRFSATNFRSMAENEASRMIAREVKIRVAGLRVNHINLGDDGALGRIMKHALKPLLADLPLKADSKGNQVLDTDAFNKRMYEPVNAARELIDELSRVDQGAEGIDDVYADYIIRTLFNADGTRNENPVNAVKGKLQAQVDYAFHVKGRALGSRAESAYGTLMNMGQAQGKEDFPGEMMKKIMDYCGKEDKMLRRFVLEVAPELCLDSNSNLRSDAAIKARVEALRSNMDEIRAISRKLPGFAKMAQVGLAVLNGKAFPPGLLTEMAQFVQRAKLDALPKLNSFSSADDVYRGVSDIRTVFQQFLKQVNVAARFEQAGENEVGGPQTIAYKSVMISMTLAKAGPGLIARLPNIVKGEAFAKANAFVFQLMGDLNNGAVTLANKDATELVIDDQSKVCTTLIDVASTGRAEPIEPQEIEINYQQDESVQYMLGELAGAAAQE